MPHRTASCAQQGRRRHHFTVRARFRARPGPRSPQDEPFVCDHHARNPPCGQGHRRKARPVDLCGQEHVILRLVTGLVAQRRAESATCSRRHAVNLVPLDEFALGGYCFHAVAHVCLCHGAHRRALALGAGGAPSRAAGGQTRPSRHGVSKPERHGTMRHARMSDVSRGCGHPLRRQVRSGRQHLGHCAFLAKVGSGANLLGFSNEDQPRWRETFSILLLSSSWEMR